MIDFLIIDSRTTYNTILGRPFLTKTKAVVSLNHLAMKIPIAVDVVTIKGDQEAERVCYIIASKESYWIVSDTQLKSYLTRDKLSPYTILGVSDDTYPKPIDKIEVPLDHQILKVKMGTPA